MNDSARAAAVPACTPPTVDLTDALRHTVRCAAGCAWCGRTLRSLQSAALAAVAAARGGLLPLGVGHGKTAIALLCATVLGAQSVIILTKPRLVDAMVAEAQLLYRHYRLVPPTVMSYDTLSNSAQSAYLDDLATRHADRTVLVVADECHALANATSARTRRVGRFFAAHPAAMFVGLSGTITAKSVKQFAHLAQWALRERSPLPHPGTDALSHWASCLDVRGKPGPQDWSATRPLWDAWGDPPDGQYRLTGAARTTWARAAFRRRLTSAPGIVGSAEGSLGTSLEIRTLAAPEPPPAIAEALRRLTDEGIDPRGDAAPDDDAAWRIGRQLSTGFFLRWVWPGDVVDRDWLLARREWHRHVRAELEDARPGYDSPLLVWNTVARAAQTGERSPLTDAFRAWAAQRHKPEPPAVATWLDTYLVEHAAAFAVGQGAPVLIWYESPEVGRAFELLGFPVYGPGTRIPEAPPGRTIVASWLVHSDGCNLQHAWAHNLVVQPPSGGRAWEQLLGRTHRLGQDADEVVCWVYAHTKPFQQALHSARADARYIEEATGNQQKLNFATITAS